MFLYAMERQQGNLWINVPVDPLMKKEPKRCQEGGELARRERLFMADSAPRTGR